jgi:hypothetical protein
LQEVEHTVAILRHVLTHACFARNRARGSAVF